MGQTACCQQDSEEAQDVVQPVAAEVDISNTSPKKEKEPAKAEAKPEPVEPLSDGPGWSREDASWKVIVNKDGGGVGMDINTKRYRYQYVVIRGVVENGVLAKANEQLADARQKAKAGDRIVSVNVAKGSREIVQQLKHENRLELEMQRVANEDPNTSD